MSEENKNWLVEIAINHRECEIPRLFSIEMPEWDRETIMRANSYIQYYNEPMPGYNIVEKGFVKYNFIEKIIDSKNNLIIFADPIPYEITEDFDTEIPDDIEDEE